MADPRQASEWDFYETSAGAEVVREEIRDVLGGKPPSIELGSLLWRIQHGKALPGDVKALGEGLSEARLTYRRDEYRLYFAITPAGRPLLLGLKFHRKGSQGAQGRAVELARKRLADWMRRI